MALWLLASVRKALHVCRGLCSSKYRLRTSICCVVTCVYSLISSLRWDIISPHVWEGGAMLTSLTSVLGGFIRHPREIRATAYVTHFSFYSVLTPFHLIERELFSVASFHPPPPPLSLFLPSYLISPSSQEAI